MTAHGIGARIAAARIAKGMTQIELAEAIHTTRQQIGKYERDEQDMTVMRLIQLSGALGLSPVDFVKIEGEK